MFSASLRALLAGSRSPRDGPADATTGLRTRGCELRARDLGLVSVWAAQRSWELSAVLLGRSARCAGPEAPAGELARTLPAPSHEPALTEALRECAEVQVGVAGASAVTGARECCAAHSQLRMLLGATQTPCSRCSAAADTGTLHRTVGLSCNELRRADATTTGAGRQARM